MIRALLAAYIAGNVTYAMTKRPATSFGVAAAAGALVALRRPPSMEVIVLSNEEPTTQPEGAGPVAGTRLLAGCGCQTYRLLGCSECGGRCGQL